MYIGLIYDSSVNHLTADQMSGTMFEGVYVHYKQYEFNSYLRQIASISINIYRL